MFLCSPLSLSWHPRYLPHGRVCVFKSISGTFHQEMRLLQQCLCPGAVRDLCNQLGVCYCKGLTGYSSVNPEHHVGIQWKTLDRLLQPEHFSAGVESNFNNSRDEHEQNIFKKLHFSGCGSPFYISPLQTTFSVPVTQNKQRLSLCPCRMAKSERTTTKEKTQ